MPIDLGDMAYAEYQKALKRADSAMRKGNKAEAAAAYRQCAELYRQYAQAANDPAVRRQRLERAQLYLDKARSLDKSVPAEPPHAAGVIPVQAAETPGVDEFGAIEVLLQAIENDRYDVVILDTAPTGHTLRLLMLPELLLADVVQPKAGAQGSCCCYCCFGCCCCCCCWCVLRCCLGCGCCCCVCWRVALAPPLGFVGSYTLR